MKTKNKTSAHILRGSTTALLLSCVIVALCSAINLPEQAPKVPPPQDNAAFGANAHRNRTLSFADRVAYQSAIEDVYWRHRIWPDTNPDPKPSLDAVMSQAQIEKKVEGYLRNSQTLEDYWQRPITADQLQAEMERMASHTKQPEVLRELFEALGNNPFVIAECLARPVLAERFANGDPVAAGVSPASTKLFAADTAASTDNRFRATNRGVTSYTLPLIASPSGGCTDDTWTPTTLTNAPAARQSHTAVWTGSEMIVWGGHVNFVGLNTGGRYNPSTDSWTATSTSNAPSARYDHKAVWTGSEMIVWGGDAGAARLNTGGRYNPITNSWTPTTLTNAPAARGYGHTAVWTGSEMIIWGGSGNNSNRLNTGGRYNPVTDSWTATSTTNAPDGRYWHTAVWTWTDSEMIVWGGFDVFNNPLNTGGRYDPGTDSWTATSTTNAPAGRTLHTAVWDDLDNLMIVWGGFDGGVPDFNTGGRYNPSTDSWAATSITDAPEARQSHTAVWTGSEMIVWGGATVSKFPPGGRYHPGTDSWRATSLINAPTDRRFHTAVWTGSEMIVWGAADDGRRYCATPSIASPYDFNHDNKPDFVLYRASTRQTAMWYMHNNVYAGGAFGPTLPAGWSLIDVADFNRDGNNDYALFNSSTRQTAIWYLSGVTRVGGAFGPTVPSGWTLVATGDFNGNGKPDFVLYKASTRQTIVWYLNNNVYAGGAYGPTLPAGWRLAGVADFNGNGRNDYALFKPSTRQTAIYYLSGVAYVGSAFGPTIASGYELIGTADFNGNGKPDYLIYNASTRRTALYYLNNSVYAGSALGPILSVGWNLVAP